MADGVTVKVRPHWADRLGWGHRGFRANRHGAKLVLAGILAVPMVFNLYGLARTPPEFLPVDFRIFTTAAETFAENPGGQIYTDHPNYLYPPFFLTVFVGIVNLPPPYDILVFQAAKWIALYISIACAWRLCAPHSEDLPPIVAVAVLLIMFRYFNNELLNGNINMLILCAVLLGAWSAARGWLLAAGAIVVVAACTKVTPALLLVYFVYKGWWRSLLGAAAGAAVCLFLWPAVIIGWSDNLRLLGEWYEHIIAGFVSRGAVYSVNINQSLVGFLNRMLGDSIAMEPDVRLAIVQLPRPVLSVIRAALSIGILGGLALVCRKRVRPATQLAFATEIALVQIAMLALSGYTWKAHYVAMLLPYSAILAYLADARYPHAARRWIWRWLIVSLLLMLLSAEIVTPVGADYMLALGVVLFSGIAAGAALVVQRRALARYEPPQPEESR